MTKTLLMTRAVAALGIAATVFAAPAAFAATTASSTGPVTVEIMTHLCNGSIHNIQDFQALEAGKGPVAALANTVLNCPTTGLPQNMAVAGTVASPRSNYDFSVAASGTAPLMLTSSGMFMAHKLCESDLGLDVNGDGMIATSTCLDISHYAVMASTTDGHVTVMESMAPAGFHLGALRFTPTVLDGNNDAAALRSLDEASGTIQLDVSNDTDHMIMLHVYNFANATSTSTTTGNGGGTDMDNSSTTNQQIQSLITSTQQLIVLLQNEIQYLQHLLATGMTGGTASGMNGHEGMGNNGQGHMAAMISPQHPSVRLGTSVDFTGRHFGHEESVSIMRDGMMVATAHADGGGNFSTGSLSVPSTVGTYTYTFMGQNSGMMATDSMTVTP